MQGDKNLQEGGDIHMTIITDEQYGALKRLVRDAAAYYKKVNDEAGLPIIMGNDVQLAEAYLASLEDRKDKIAISWHIDDVKGMEGYEDLTDDEAREVLELTANNHDATIGVSWDTLEVWADEVKSRRK